MGCRWDIRLESGIVGEVVIGAKGASTLSALSGYRGTDYSVPVAYGHCVVWIKGFVNRVVIGCAAEVIAIHLHSYSLGYMMFDPVHYLPLSERKIMAFDQEAPLQGWELPKAFSTMLRLLEARQNKTGKRQYVLVLRLLEGFEMDALHFAIKDALQMRAVNFDAIKHLLHYRIERRAPRLDLGVYPLLPRTDITTTSAAAFACADGRFCGFFAQSEAEGYIACFDTSGCLTSSHGRSEGLVGTKRDG